MLLGFSSQTKQFLEELAICEANSAPSTVAILDTMQKKERLGLRSSSLFMAFHGVSMHFEPFSEASRVVRAMRMARGSRIEQEIKRQNTFTGDLKIVCRNGLPSSATDLWKVGADVCSRRDSLVDLDFQAVSISFELFRAPAPSFQGGDLGRALAAAARVGRHHLRHAADAARPGQVRLALAGPYLGAVLPWEERDLHERPLSRCRRPT